MGHSPRQNSNRDARTQVVHATPDHQLLIDILQWIVDDEYPRLFIGITDLKGFVDLIEDTKSEPISITWSDTGEEEDQVFEVVDGVFGAHWVAYNTNQIVCLHRNSGTYFIVRTQIPNKWEFRNDDWGCTKAKPMTICKAKINHREPPHDSLEGELKRVCFDLRGSMIWLSDRRFKDEKTGKVYFPNRWSAIGSEQQRIEFSSRRRRVNSQAETV